MGATAAAVIIAREKRIVAAFRGAGATTPSTAIPPATMGIGERVAFRRLCRRAVLREATPGAFYLDEPSWKTLRTSRQRVVLLAVIGLVIGLIVGTLI